uniref:Uncharacterized protein n=1 Tax=Anopheles albimanus TaxID=7167 RepID=A0A182FRG7_ANOAL
MEYPFSKLIHLLSSSSNSGSRHPHQHRKSLNDQVSIALRGGRTSSARSRCEGAASRIQFPWSGRGVAVFSEEPLNDRAVSRVVIYGYKQQPSTDSPPRSRNIEPTSTSKKVKMS